jgi:hypothetical protein
MQNQSHTTHTTDQLTETTLYLLRDVPNVMMTTYHHHIVVVDKYDAIILSSISVNEKQTSAILIDSVVALHAALVGGNSG